MGTFAEVPVAQAIRARWKWFVGSGVVLAILGLVALWNYVDATLITTIYVGFLLLFAGVVQFIGAFAQPGALGGRLVQAILGVIYAVVGFDLIADPFAGAIMLTIVIAIMLIADGVIRLWTAFTERPRHMLLIGTVGVINILLGAWLWTGIPFSSVAIGLFVGLQLLMGGITWITAGWMARSLPDTTSASPA